MTIVYAGCPCDVLWGRYADNGRVAVSLRDAATGEPVATVTINIPEQDHLLGADEVFINHDCVSMGHLPDLLDSGLFEGTGRVVRSGYVEFVVARLLVSPPTRDAEGTRP